MSPTSPRARRRAAAPADTDKPKTAKPRGAQTTKTGAKTAKPRASKATVAKPAQPAPAAQHELFASSAPTPQPRPAPVRAPATPRAAAPAEPEQRRRGLLLFILIPLLMLGSFWIGRLSNRAASQDTITIMAATPAAAAGTTGPGGPQTVSSLTQAAATTTAAKKPGLIARFLARRRASETSLVEVSVGTTSRGGMMLRFDHPVSWQSGFADSGESEIDVRGVRALGTFPRNLPLPPGVTAIRAGITAPDILNLKFRLQPGMRVTTVPETGPATALNIYFRSPGDEAPAASTAP